MKKQVIVLALCAMLPLTALCQSKQKHTRASSERMTEMSIRGEWIDQPSDSPKYQSDNGHETQKMAQPKAKRAKNVIIIIGDGMGTAQVYSSIVAQRGKSNFLRFPFSGFSRTYSNNKYTTDSGAGGTAIVGGKKTNNKFVGMAADSTDILSFLELAHAQGMSTGFVVTCSVLDATPASTYGTVPYRKMFDTLSDQFSHTPFEVMIGGGLHEFLPENRKDGKHPLDTLVQRGYEVAYSLDALRKAQSNKLVALVSEPFYTERASVRGPLLQVGVEKALNILTQNKEGFAMMIEGSQIDWACHSNDAEHMAEEMADFEKMLQIVLDFAERDGNTLVVVTADHETGGLVLLNGDIEKGTNECKYMTGDHSGVMVPVFAYGPGAEQFSGIQNNTEIFAKLFKAMGKTMPATKK